MRLTLPAAFLAAAAGLALYNSENTGSVVVFPFVDVVFPSTRGDPEAMSTMSAVLLASLGGVFLVQAAMADWIRGRRRAP